MKRLICVLLSVFILVFSLITISYADAYHGGGNTRWAIPGSDYTSNIINWTAGFTIPKGNLYIESKASMYNNGVTDYYQVAVSSSSPTCSKIKVGLSTLSTRTINWKATGGVTYGTFAQRWDTTMTTDIYNGYTYIFSTNNS